MSMADQGANQDVKIMLQDAIMAMQAASASAHQATSAMAGQASHPGLKALLQQGTKHSETWRQRLAQAAQQVGAAQTATGGNPVIDAIQQVGGQIVRKAGNPVARDLGIIAGGQLAVHYYIAAFGTMAAYAKMLALPEVAQAIHDCLQEAKRADERYTALAAEVAA